MSPKLEIFLKINALNYVNSFSYLLKCIPEILPITKHFWAKEYFQHCKASYCIEGSIIFKGQKYK